MSLSPRLRKGFSLTALSLLFISTGLGLARSLWAKSAKSARSYQEAFDQYRQFNGAVLISKEGKIVFQAAKGFTDYQRTAKLNPASAFNLASLSKPFTALAINQLAETGQLLLTDKVQKYIPLPYPDITIDQLLGHRSGLTEYLDLADQHADSSKTLHNRDVLKLYQRYRPTLLFKPGSQYQYSNAGYVILALLVEAVSKQSFASYVQNHIFEPAGMKNSFVYEPGKTVPLVKGIRQLGPMRLENDLGWLDGVVGDGGIYSSVIDLYHWQQALWQAKLISKAGLERMISPGKLNDGSLTSYGYGWVVNPAHHLVLHNGSWVGFRSLLVYNHKRGHLIVALNNNGAENNQQILEALIASQP